MNQTDLTVLLFEKNLSSSSNGNSSNNTSVGGGEFLSRETNSDAFFAVFKF